jgi:uncharacterized protein YcbX
MPATITQLNVYPVKSCKGVALSEALLTKEGLENDRQWLIVEPGGQFLTQRELPRLALIAADVSADELRLDIPGVGSICVPPPLESASRRVRIWRDECRGFDCGDEVAHILTRFLEREIRLVKFDSSVARFSDRHFTGEIIAPQRFSDGFPILLIAEESLEDLNGRLPSPLPMNRFRPNLVIRGLGPYAEDLVHEFHVGAVTMRVVKPCMRCQITATDQATAKVDEREPLRTLRTYRWNKTLRGVAFGQNLVVVAGSPHSLSVGQPLSVTRRGERR